MCESNYRSWITKHLDSFFLFLISLVPLYALLSFISLVHSHVLPSFGHEWNYRMWITKHLDGVSFFLSLVSSQFFFIFLWFLHIILFSSLTNHENIQHRAQVMANSAERAGSFLSLRLVSSHSLPSLLRCERQTVKEVSVFMCLSVLLVPCESRESWLREWRLVSVCGRGNTHPPSLPPSVTSSFTVPPLTSLSHSWPLPLPLSMFSPPPLSFPLVW